MRTTRAKRFLGPKWADKLDLFLQKPNVKYVDLEIGNVQDDAGQLFVVVLLVYEEDDGIIEGV